MNLTIEQLIDQLSILGMEIGHKSKVQAWYVGGRENIKPLDVLNATEVQQGRLNQTQERTAVIKISL